VSAARTSPDPSNRIGAQVATRGPEASLRALDGSRRARLSTTVGVRARGIAIALQSLLAAANGRFPRRGAAGESRIAADALVALAALAVLAALACSGSDQPTGEITGPGRPPSHVAAKLKQQRAVQRALASSSFATAQSPKTILFGDLHVHTSYSIDAFLYSLPLFGGEGVHPPADACDFARYCADLDFFSLNDHAEGLTPERWQRSIESLRACDARAGDTASPDLVAFLGWEWTQTGTTPETHFGHKNVIVPGLDPKGVPPRPISALADDAMDRARLLWLARIAEAAATLGADPYADFLWWIRRLADVPFCPRDVDTRELPPDCHENAPTPERLFAKLAQWGGESLVIPHGLTWGIHAPPGASLGPMLEPGRFDPQRERLLEVFSGHGNNERYDAAAAAADSDALAGVCTPPTDELLPCCWQAGEIVRSRCGDLPAEECEARVEEARQLALEAGRRPQWVLPDTSPADWLDCDQTRGAFKPTSGSRPRMSAQFGLALSRFDPEDGAAPPARLRFGLIGSSDNHTARPGSGYKQLHRKGMSDARGLVSERSERWLAPFAAGSSDDPARATPSPPSEMGFRALLDVERASSFLYPGGLVAVHARGRDRRAIWDALVRREVYGTSGPRMLLWFDLLNGPEGPAPMGSAVRLGTTPAFEVRAVGSFVQQPGCPEASHLALGEERLERLCLGECQNPGEQRIPIEAIEVVRIRPQQSPDERIEDLIDDPWVRIRCPGDPEGCVVRFADPTFARGGRDSVYYVRALQAETPAINGANLRAEFDAEGRAVSVRPCYGGYRTDPDDDCLAEVAERAWSSPIFVDHAGR